MRNVIGRAFALTIIALISLASLSGLVWCEEIILSEHVELISVDSPDSRAYDFDLTAGDTISISISVSGDSLNFYIYNSTGHELYRETNIMTLEDQWTVPSDDTYGFVIETWAGEDAQSSVDITLYRASVSLHDIAVTSVVPSPTEVYEGDSVNIMVVTQNNGDFTETFTVTTYANTTTIQTQTVSSLAPGSQTTLTFTWDTTGVALGDYTIKAEVDVVPGETYAEDNVKVDDEVAVIPEFSPFFFLLLFTVTTLAAVLVNRKIFKQHRLSSFAGA